MPATKGNIIEGYPKPTFKICCILKFKAYPGAKKDIKLKHANTINATANTERMASGEMLKLNLNFLFLPLGIKPMISKI